MSLCAAFAITSALATAQAPHPTGAKPLPSREELAKLPADGGPEFNRLVFEKSPYLVQHARNPVDWHPWGPAAFARAREDAKPVFLSIGYSTCHWCHVMERESFEDAEIAAFLNEKFVCVKVDREERPDVDEVYMTFCTAINQSGGWPLTAFLTPDRQPFFAGTYFPPRDRDGRPGLLSVARTLASAWERDREAVVKHADGLVTLVREAVAPAPGDIDTIGVGAVMERAAQGLVQLFDAEHGGFGPAPKFPLSQNLRFLLRWSARKGDGKALHVVETTLDALACGGIHDHVGGGFHRYSTDRAWRVPHFEKMLYDQALLALTYVEAFQRTKEPAWRAVAQDVFAYVLRDLAAPGGGFFAAEDADSEGEEGRFYLWTKPQVAELLGAAHSWQLTEADASTDSVAGVAHLARPYAPHVRPEIEVQRAKLLAARGARPRPTRDEKILTDWNGLMIAALARGGSALGDPALTAAARRAADFALTELRRDNGLLWKRSAGGEAAHDGVLDDYAFLAWGLLELYQADLDPRWLAEAVRTTDMLLGQFRDDADGALWLTARSAEALVLRSKPATDGALPGGASVAARVLFLLAHATGDRERETRAREVLRASAGSVSADPTAYTELLQAWDLALGPVLEIVVVGKPEAEDTRALIAAVRGAYLPNAVLLFRPQGVAEHPLAKLAPWTDALAAGTGAATAYVCSGSVCDLPITDPARLAKRLEHPYAPPAAQQPAPK